MSIASHAQRLLEHLYRGVCEKMRLREAWDAELRFYIEQGMTAEEAVTMVIGQRTPIYGSVFSLYEAANSTSFRAADFGKKKSQFDSITHGMAGGGGIVLESFGMAGTTRVIGGALKTPKLSSRLDTIVTPQRIGPGIGRSGYWTVDEFNQAVFTRYQKFYEQADAIAQSRISAKLWPDDPLFIGRNMDDIARNRLREWLKSEGVIDEPGGLASVNRRLYNDAGDNYAVPDLRIDVAKAIYDGTIAVSPPKTMLTPQLINFNDFSAGAHITIVRPMRLGGPYSVLFE